MMAFVGELPASGAFDKFPRGEFREKAAFTEMNRVE
jgi:hypothetical protein